MKLPVTHCKLCNSNLIPVATPCPLKIRNFNYLAIVLVEDSIKAIQDAAIILPLSVLPFPRQ